MIDDVIEKIKKGDFKNEEIIEDLKSIKNYGDIVERKERIREKAAYIFAKAHLANLSKAEITLIEWILGISGGFTTGLFNLYSSADYSNRIKFENGFPEETKVLNKFYNEPNYLDELSEKIGYKL